MEPMTAPFVPAHRPAAVAAPPPHLVDGVLAGALAEMAAATRAHEVAGAAVQAALAWSGGRAAAVGRLDDRGRTVEVLASSGYDCDTMGAGARLPADAGLPLTESAVTGRQVRTGAPAGWVAVPLPSAQLRAALVVSLLTSSTVDLERLQVLAEHTGAALERTDREERARRALRRAELTVSGAPAWLEAAARVLPQDDTVGGDVVELMPAAHGRLWWIVADVCGSGIEAAVVGAQLRTALRALAPHVHGPAALLTELERVLDGGPIGGRFVTAAAGLIWPDPARGVEARLSLAGHPPVLLWRDGGVTPLGEPTQPLNLGLARPEPLTETAVVLGPDDLLLAHTDGLTDRLGAADGDDALRALFARCGGLADTEAVAEALVAALHAAAGPARDDLALLALRPRPR